MSIPLERIMRPIEANAIEPPEPLYSDDEKALAIHKAVMRMLDNPNDVNNALLACSEDVANAIINGKSIRRILCNHMSEIVETNSIWLGYVD